MDDDTDMQQTDEVADFLASYCKNVVIGDKFELMKKLELKLEWDNDGVEYYTLPESSNCEYAGLISKANYEAYLERYSDVGVERAGDECIITKENLSVMPPDRWDNFYDTLKRVIRDYPIIDEEIYSRLESEERDIVWENCYREEFQEKMAEFEFEGFRDDQFRQILADNEKTDDLFYYLDSIDSLDWELGDTTVYASIGKYVDEVDRDDVLSYMLKNQPFPPGQDDPRQLSFADYSRRLHLDVDQAVESVRAKNLVNRMLG